MNVTDQDVERFLDEAFGGLREKPCRELEDAYVRWCDAQQPPLVFYFDTFRRVMRARGYWKRYSPMHRAWCWVPLAEIEASVTAKLAQARRREGGWLNTSVRGYCQNPRCDVRQVGMNLKEYDGPPHVTHLDCPACGKPLTQIEVAPETMGNDTG
jgi:hypothetical protein